MVNVKWRTNKQCRQWNCPLKSLQLSPLCCKWSFTALETDCGLKISCTAQAIRVCVCVYTYPYVFSTFSKTQQNKLHQLLWFALWGWNVSSLTIRSASNDRPRNGFLWTNHSAPAVTFSQYEAQITGELKGAWLYLTFVKWVSSISHASSSPN